MISKISTISLHLIFSSFVQLSVGDKAYFYNWESGVQTPREIYPRLSLADYDSDGVNELAVVICTGYGTGCYSEMLVIIEINDGMGLTAVTGETIESLLYHRLSGSYEESSDEVTIRLDNQTICIEWAMDELRNNNECNYEGNPEFTGFDLKSLIWFNIDNGTLAVEASIGYFLLYNYVPSDYFCFSSDIMYNQDVGGISLFGCHILKDTY